MNQELKRRFEDHLPTQPLDWEDPEVKHARESTRLANAMADAGAAFLAHMDTGGAIAAIPNSAPQQYVVAGTLAMIAKVLPAEPVPPLTAPAPLTDEVARKALQRIARWHGEFPATGKTWEESGNPMSYAACYGSNGERDYMRQVALDALAKMDAAAPAPQQSELSNERIFALWEQVWNVNPVSLRLDFARAIEAEVANKAAPAAPVQTKPTDLSKRLREAATAEVNYADARLLIGAAEEIERYYGGMLAWKQTAEKKDRDWNAERMGRVNDRIASNLAAPVQTAVPSYWNSQRKIIERAIVGLRDGFATRKDADDALAILGSGWAAPVQAEQAQAEPDDLPETTDQAREYLVEWHKANMRTAPYFSNYISKELAGDFAFHLARWLARNALPAQAEQALASSQPKR